MKSRSYWLNGFDVLIKNTILKFTNGVIYASGEGKRNELCDEGTSLGASSTKKITIYNSTRAKNIATLSLPHVS
jgi:hypothetical protein